MVLAFGAPKLIIGPEIYDYLKKSYPNANVVFASTTGEIMGSDVYDDSIVVPRLSWKNHYSLHFYPCKQTGQQCRNSTFLEAQLEKND
ncbi:FIST N-terminal domain-containing protein [Mucilaginibacter sp. P4]|uniref:FIST N-terminal domain-containing protein n=1 Tax=Mucilaginibacter TaxID=423349 RepID=UPI000DCB8628